MQETVVFSPHIVTLQCPNCVMEVRDKDCLSDGLYCLIPPKESVNQKYNVSETGLLLEALYGRCVHEVVKDSEQDLKSYFNYLLNVRMQCFELSAFSIFTNQVSETAIKNCAESQISKIGIDLPQVQDCLKNSFQVPGKNTTNNYLLLNDKLLAEAYGLSIHPAVTINGQLYRGDLDGEDIFRAICASFTPSYRPVQCMAEFNATKELQQHNSRQDFVRPAHGRLHLFLSLLAVVLANALCVYGYRKYAART